MVNSGLKGLKHNLTHPKTDLILLKLRGFRKRIYMKFLSIHGNLSPTSSHLHPLQVENCDSNSRLVVDEDDNGKLRHERVNKPLKSQLLRTKCVFKHQDL